MDSLPEEQRESVGKMLKTIDYEDHQARRDSKPKLEARIVAERRANRPERPASQPSISSETVQQRARRERIDKQERENQASARVNQNAQQTAIDS